MTIWEAFLLGVVEGITEFLPISSTGHLILAARLLQIPPSEFLKSFEVAIQLGAILAVVVLYGRSLILNTRILKRVIAAFLPTAVLGLGLYRVIKTYLLNNDIVVVWSLLIGGVFLILFEKCYKESRGTLEDIGKMPYPTAMIIGLFQSLAMIPGVSRAGATIIGGLVLGLKRKTIVEFSFLLAVPTMLAATALDLYKSAGDFTGAQIGLLGVGGLSAFIVAILGIKFLLHFIKTHNFIPFGIYRILIALAFWR